MPVGRIIAWVAVPADLAERVVLDTRADAALD
ncbi:hypothetical protein FBY03_101290 [Pseudomonas sp. SJZ079]|nr:hypothetical protein FBY03_101290 [Pseudomonas sp. SJZ079]